MAFPVKFCNANLPKHLNLLRSKGDFAGKSGRITPNAHMLQNLGFGFDDDLFALVSAWRNLIQLANADFVVCEHSPIALLACQSLGVETIQVGTGFTIPPHPLSCHDD